MSHDAHRVPITFRHLVSAGSLNASNPLRVISLVDVDAAYAQFEASRLGVDSSVVPLAVQQWNGLIAISYAARKFGITRHETVESAKEKCPEIRLVHVATYAEGAQRAEYNEDPSPTTHKVSLDPYRRESRKIVAIFDEMCPLGAVEKASIDELYCDLTLAVRQVILQRFPELARPPANSPLGLDTPLPPPPKIDWTDLGYRVPTEGAHQESAEGDDAKDAQEADKQASRQEELQESVREEIAADTFKTAAINSSPPLVQQAASWTDYALACGAELILKIRQEVMDRLGYTMSAGIAPNKTLAKLSAGMKKPNCQTILVPGAIHAYLKDLPFQKIRFLGGKLGDAIAKEWERSTVGDLWSVTLAELQEKVGDESKWVYDVLRGIDHTPVIERTANKTMLASKNVKPPIRTLQEAQRWISILSLELCVRLKEAREESPNIWPSTMVLRYLKAGETARSRQSSFPFVRDLKPESVAVVAERLWGEAVGEQMSSGKQLSEIIVIALGFSGLEAGEQGQRSIEGFFTSKAAASNAKVPALAAASPPIPQTISSKRERALEGETMEGKGEDGRSPSPLGVVNGTIGEPSAKKIKKVKASGLQSLFQKAAEVTSPLQPEAAQPSVAQDASLDSVSPAPLTEEAPSMPSWTCPECQAKILPRAHVGEPGRAEEGEDSDRRLAQAKQDHEDWHFAVNLQKEHSAALQPRGSLGPSASQAPASQRSASQKGGGGKGSKDKKANKNAIQNFFKKGG
ncbi:DNA/RNA polymerase [Microstroma glucosiphilum]|uniref:DNA polymerase eta n=1 Tax=Pseudomicrostroma glucosiphilum TaxID=1684307 RepID=A0A316UDR8_9BASI|nr:DNA/RNA polymerase [Pseudomicrostroma glucosiphilum]PWN23340.1 DNA/RNA polymerase [Pseudomicrostroma glucosiphilum]